MNKINWFKNNPSQIGLHFVAIKYGEGAGTYDFLHWDGNKWLTDYDGNVIGYTTLDGLIRDLPIEWPENNSEEVKVEKSIDLDADKLWDEM